MATRKWRMREHFRGPVIFGSAGDPVDSTWYGDTASAVMKFDASEDELYLDGIDLWIKDDDQLEFGNVSDFVIDWNNTSSELLFLPAAAGNTIHWGSSSVQVDVDWDVRNVDIDLYGTDPEVDITRNLTAGATAAAVVAINQSNASDDQVALKVTQLATGYVGVDIDCGVDIDSNYTAGAGLAVTRDLVAGSTDEVVVLFEQSNASDDQATLKVTQAAVGYAAVDIDGAVDIDSNYTGGAGLAVSRDLVLGSTNSPVALIEQSNSGDDQVALKLTQAATAYAALDVDGGVDVDSAYTGGAALDVRRNLTSGASTSTVVYIKQDNDSDDKMALQVVQDATAVAAIDVDGAVDIDSTYTGGAALDVARNLASGASTGAVAIFANSNATDDMPTVQITQTAADVAALDINGAIDLDISSAFSSGAGLRATRNLTSGNTDAALVIFEQSNASDNMVALQVTQGATGYAGVDFDCALDIDSAHTGAALDVLRDLTSGVTSAAVVHIVQDQSGDDQPALQIQQDATSALALDANGWCDIGYEAAASPTGTPPTGSVKILYANSRWWWVVDTDGGGTLRYVELSATSTA